jgi:CO dehydrogenase/acetyl-CoA synthase alpha subunit
MADVKPPTREDVARELALPSPQEAEPDWTKKCIVCDATPVLPITEMCGPCTFGEADTAGGNW